MRDTIFISHATPEDNEFSRWLAFKLMGLGYKIWCDLFHLKGGEDFWSEIENEIRNNSVKFLFVLTSTSNNREGTLKEVAVAVKTKKVLNDSHFIIPLHLDSKLSYDDINIDLIRLNSVDFKSNWAKGLSNLKERLQEDNVVKSEVPDYDKISTLWETIANQDRAIIEKEEIYTSNWFKIETLPKCLYFHKFEAKIPKNPNYGELRFPVVQFKNHIATFAWAYDFMDVWPCTTSYDPKLTYSIPTLQILDGTFDSKFISNNEAKKILIQLLNKNLDRYLDNHEKLTQYPLSNSMGYWYRDGMLDKNKYGRVAFVGTQKDKKWHFGISTSIKLFPEPLMGVKSHIFFTTDGHNLIQEKSTQHSSRRKQGRNWWNNAWRSRLNDFVASLSTRNNIIEIVCGTDEKMIIQATPICFKSSISYIEPNSEAPICIEDFNGEEDHDE
ncbi:MAG: toll/interleukin-1 receptor domain-containing protein [Alistipes sp.]|jgi:hypothetical protein|nr:toll/interleukin-1 receptor domain-containing protein [Alistipes sp.]